MWETLRDLTILGEFKRLIAAITTLIALVGILHTVDSAVPDEMTAYILEIMQENPVFTFTENPSQQQTRAVFSAAGEDSDSYEKIYTAKLFDIIPIKKVTVTFFKERMLESV